MRWWSSTWPIRQPSRIARWGSRTRSWSWSPASLSPLEDDRLEVFAWDDHRAVVGSIEPSVQLKQVGSQGGRAGLADGLERLHSRAVVLPPVAHEVLRRSAAEDVEPPVDVQLGQNVANQLAKAILCAPLDGRSHTGRGRYVPGDGLEQLADESLRGVGDETDAASGATDPRQLACGPILVRGKHRPKDRGHDLEGPIRIRQ